MILNGIRFCLRKSFFANKKGMINNPYITNNPGINAWVISNV